MARGRKKTSDKHQELILRTPDEVDKNTVAISKDLNTQMYSGMDFKGWKLVQRKLFVLVLTKINWRRSGNDVIVLLKNEDIAKELGWEVNENDFRSVGQRIRDEFDYMVKNSGLSLQNPKTQKWYTGNLIYDAYGDSSVTYVKLNPNFMTHFEGLIQTAVENKKPYLSFIYTDTTNFKCNYTDIFYRKLRDVWNAKNEYQTFKIETRELKQLLGMKEEDYMKKDKNTGELTHFDRYGFEKYVIDAIVKDLLQCENIELLACENGKYYEKEKKRGFVQNYVFKFRILTTEEIKKNREEMIKLNERVSVVKKRKVLQGEIVESNKEEEHLPDAREFLAGEELEFV